MRIQLYTDGASRGNPGPSGAGVVLYDDQGKLLMQQHTYLGFGTNNVAEYRALLTGLNLARDYAPCSLQVFVDSELLCRQMQGEYRVKHPMLIEFCSQIKKLMQYFTEVKFTHIPREQNKVADALANKAIDTQRV